MKNKAVCKPSCRICGSKKLIYLKESARNGANCRPCNKKLMTGEYDSMYIRPEMHYKKVAYCMRCGRLLSHKADMTNGANLKFHKIPTLQHHIYYRDKDKYVVCDSCLADIIRDFNNGNEFIIKGFSDLFQRYPYNKLKQ